MDKQRLWIIGSLVVVAAIAALGWFVGISPAMDAASLTASNAADVEQQNQVLEIKTTQLAKEMEKLPEYQTQLAALQAGIPDKPDQEVLYRELAGLAAANGVSITSLTMVQPEQLITVADLSGSRVSGDNFQTITISLELNGPYANVAAFVDAVQNGSRLVVFSDFSITALAGDGSDAFGGSVQLATMKGLAFSFGAAPAPLTQGETPAPTTGTTSESTDASGK